MIAPSKQIYTYYPGCSLTATNRAYDVSTRNVASVLGVELVDLEDWNCCGATAYTAIMERRSFILSARNLALAEKEKRDMVTVCAGCYLALHKTNKYFGEDPELRKVIRQGLQAGGEDYNGTIRVRHFLDVVVNDLGEEVVKQHVVREFKGLKVAPYYGCQITRPFGEIDDPDFPSCMGRLMEWIGAESLDFPMMTKCCGGMLMTTRAEVGRDLTGRILLEAKKAGADCIATACPLCQINLEAYQSKISRQMKADCSIPVLYFTQLLGLTLGLESKQLTLGDNLTPTEPVLAARSQ
ncbi:MAG: CoB--CoM heterodisulfide reductase iron-sulfur subunit B family protein [Gemmatimonadota bacterium]|nr:CoB--CoM heterodisulfide reductase iron-sulfur subunit B family protein [Gemmatimonadota bacterium]